ncbi:MAG TPA: hypothetical protein VIV60_10895, partial [Polyangiaceae bacterium]
AAPASASNSEAVRRAGSTRPNALHTPSGAALQPRPVGWIQALGLAALAGMVTFAATVPLASWVRKRQTPVVAEAPVVQQTMPSTTHSKNFDQHSANTDPAVALPEQRGQDSAQPLAATGESPSASASPFVSAATASAVLQDNPAPSDVSLAPGQALVEVLTGGGHAIFVDDAFVGRGPIRVITVAAGHHTLRTRLNGVERNDSIEISPGRLLRVSLEQAWK